MSENVIYKKYLVPIRHYLRTSSLGYCITNIAAAILSPHPHCCEALYLMKTCDNSSMVKFESCGNCWQSMNIVVLRPCIITGHAWCGNVTIAQWKHTLYIVLVRNVYEVVCNYRQDTSRWWRLCSPAFRAVFLCGCTSYHYLWWRKLRHVQRRDAAF